MELVATNPEPRTPGWWLKRLAQRMDDRVQRIERYDAYYRGDHNLKFATPKFREVFGGLFSEFSDNWCALIPDAVDERLEVVGFRYGDDTEADRTAWRMWQENELDAGSQMGHLEALVSEESYGLVWPSADDASQPSITIEHPLECIVEFEIGSRRRRAAALKRWIDDDGWVMATLYLPDAIYKYRSARKAQSRLLLASQAQWIIREVDNEPWPLRNPFGVVPVVPLMNSPRLIGGGVSEIADAMPVQDAINKTISDLLVTSEFAAAPRRYATGFTPPKDENGKPLPLETMVNRMLTTSQKDANFGQFPQADLGNFVSVIEMFVQHLASRSRTPPHYFYLSGQFPSGETIKSAETGLVAKTTRKQIHFGEAWEEVLRLAFAVKGNKARSQERSAETVWKDAESRSESEHMDAIGKRRALLHIPLEQAWQDAGYSPQQIQRMKEQLREEKDWLGELGLTETSATDTQISAGMTPVGAESSAPALPA